MNIPWSRTANSNSTELDSFRSLADDVTRVGKLFRAIFRTQAETRLGSKQMCESENFHVAHNEDPQSFFRANVMFFREWKLDWKSFELWFSSPARTKAVDSFTVRWKLIVLKIENWLDSVALNRLDRLCVELQSFVSLYCLHLVHISTFSSHSHWYRCWNDDEYPSTSLNRWEHDEDVCYWKFMAFNPSPPTFERHNNLWTWVDKRRHKSKKLRM